MTQIGTLMYKKNGESANYLSIYNDCIWVHFGGNRYESRFGKKKTLVLITSQASSDMKEIMENTEKNAMNEIGKRLSDTQDMINDLVNTAHDAPIDSELSESEYKYHLLAIQKHKKTLVDLFQQGREIPVKYSKTNKTTEWHLHQGQRYAIGDHIVVWFRFYGEINVNSAVVNEVHTEAYNTVVLPNTCLWSQLERKARLWLGIE